jgi:hypothetical protein
MLLRVRSLVGIVLVAGAVTGCANSDEIKARFNGRWGPDPAMQPVDVATVARAGYMAADGTLIRPLGASDYAEIAQWGFNIGRQDCEIYMDNLFRLSREKGRNDNILAAASTAAAAIDSGRRIWTLHRTQRRNFSELSLHAGARDWSRRRSAICRRYFETRSLPAKSRSAVPHQPIMQFKAIITFAFPIRSKESCFNRSPTLIR